tara:strand:- start:232 stop:2100 length:1869 start_codon:yes stop_codon:yes gene_type:complete
MYKRLNIKMKKTLLFIFSLLTLSLSAQDGVNYQGAATDANGDELINQSISIRASVLSGSASGNLEWEETHTTTTDQFGLFNVVIGQGTNTTNGAIASFDDMDWGSGNHFLKIEMDASGGTNYAMIGTTQMMSVPYALYAKSSGIDSAAIAAIIGSSGGGMGGYCDFKFPDGFEMITAVTSNYGPSSNYTVPSNKRLYISSASTTVYINGLGVSIPSGMHILCNPGDVISHPASSYLFHGFLVDANTSVTSITANYSPSSNYMVPSHKKLFISSASTTVYINGLGVSIPSGNHVVCNAGDIISHPASTYIFHGYLVDENYFAGCGGGGSSSSASAVDSAMVAGMIANAGGGSSFGDFISINTTIENQAPSDGFLYGQYYLGGPSDSWIKVYCDTFSGNTNIRGYYENNPYGGNFDVQNTFMIPIKKKEFYSFSSGGWGPPSINNVYFVPLESEGGGGSSSASSGASNNNTVDSIIKADLSCYVTYVGGTNPQPGFSSSDTLSVDYQEGRSLVISGDFHAPSGMSQVSLQITDDSFSTIPSHKYKVNGFHSKGGSYGGNPLTDMYHSITQASSFYPNSLFFEPNSYFSLDIDFFNLNTTKIHIYIIVDHAGGSSSGNGNINIQY